MLNAILSKNILSAAFCLFLSITTFAQKWELGGFLGGSNYAGDLARVIVPNETYLSAGILSKYNFNKYFAWRESLTYGRISGNDKNFPEYVTRNLSFTSDIWELGTMFEFNFTGFGSEVLTENRTLYVFTGINVFYFNPRTKHNGQWVKLQPLGTEGQTLEGGKKYLPVGISIPLGIGYKYNFSDFLVIGLEAGFRKTFTDYLDDVSKSYPDLAELEKRSGYTAVQLSDRSYESDPYLQKSAAGDMRGNPNLKDWYVMAGITLTYRFHSSNCFYSLY